MRLREVYLGKALTIGDSATLNIQIPVGLKIQHIRVKIAANNGATSNTVGKLNGMVSKIEVVNGSDSLHSLSMQEGQALNFYHNGTLPFKSLNGSAGATVTEEYVVEFGRYIGDPVYYLDTARFQNPFLKITQALTISATAGFATGTGVVSAIATVIDDAAPPYKGFIMRKEIQSVSTAASGDNETLMPLDYPYAGILVQALKTTILPDAILTNLKLSIDADRLIPFDSTATDVLEKNIDDYGEAVENFVPLSDTTVTFLSDIYYRGGAVFDIAGATGKGLISSVTAESVVGTMTTAQAAGTMRIRIAGYSPHSTFYLPFGPGGIVTPDDSGYFDPRQGVSQMKLKATQGTSAAALKIVAEQLRV